jgi:hypothetical protein
VWQKCRDVLMLRQVTYLKLNGFGDELRDKTRYPNVCSFVLWEPSTWVIFGRCPLLCYATNATTCWTHFHGNTQKQQWKRNCYSSWVRFNIINSWQHVINDKYKVGWCLIGLEYVPRLYYKFLSINQCVSSRSRNISVVVSWHIDVDISTVYSESKEVMKSSKLNDSSFFTFEVMLFLSTMQECHMNTTLHDLTSLGTTGTKYEPVETAQWI